jgi:hypothetical protein
MLGWDNFVGCWFVMNIYSALTAPSSISPASGLRFGGVFETRSRLMVNLLLSPEKDLARSHVVKTIYDPACGTGGMLSVSEKYINDL